jgi:hypothetical protein
MSLSQNTPFAPASSRRFFAVLCSIICVVSRSVAHGPPHDVLTPTTVSSSRIFTRTSNDGTVTDRIQVDWVFLNQQDGNGRALYQCTITKLDNNAVAPFLSAYNIALQGRLVDVILINADGSADPDSVKLGVQDDQENVTWTAVKDLTEQQRLIPRGTAPQSHSANVPNPPKKKKIRFITFSGKTCILTVASGRYLHPGDSDDGGPSPSKSAERSQRGGKQGFSAVDFLLKIFTSHDTTPPPPDPGGPDGQNEP